MKRSVLVLVTGIAMTMMGACRGPSTQAPDDLPGQSGVKGQVWIGPFCPPAVPGTDCADLPYEAQLSVMNMDGEVIVEAKSDKDGKFEIALLPGEYLLRASPLEDGPQYPAFPSVYGFSVNPGEWTELTVKVDTGVPPSQP